MFYLSYTYFLFILLLCLKIIIGTSNKKISVKQIKPLEVKDKMKYYVSPRHHMARRMAHKMAQHDHKHSESVHIPVDVIAIEDDYLLRAFVPGVDAKDVKIEVLDNTITISGEFPVDDNEDSKYLLREVPSGSFSRSLRMPTELDASKAEAEVVNGVLSLRVSKAEVAKAHQVKVKTK